MKTASIIKALNKAGFAVLETGWNCSAQNGNIGLSWHKNSHNDNVSAIRISNLKNPNQSEIDYFTDHYCYTIKSAVSYLKKG